jgi:hypothetical protein
MKLLGDRDDRAKRIPPKPLRWACHEADLWERAKVPSDLPNQATRYANQFG